MDNNTRKLLGITDPNIKFSDNWLLSNNKKQITRWSIMGTLTYKPKACPNCGAVNNHSITKHGFCTVCHPFGLFRRQPLDLKINTQRFYCHLCHTTFMATSPLFDANTSISKALRHEIVLRLTRVESIKDIADDLGISASTVQRTVKSLANQITNPSRNYLPEILCIDEFKSMRSVSGKMSFIAVDGNRHELFEILEDRRLYKLFNHYQSFSRKARENVKYLVMDMNSSYYQLVNQVFPNAQIVYDRFHIIKHLNDTMNHVRIHVYNRLRRGNSLDQKRARRLKHYWRLFLKPFEELSNRPYYEGRYFKREVTSKTILNLMLEYDDELNATYQYIQELVRCYHHHKVHHFLELLHKRIPGVSHYTSHRCHNLFRRRAGIKRGLTFAFSNGQTEGFNNRIKLIKRIAFGYRNFTTFKTRIYLIINHKITVK